MGETGVSNEPQKITRRQFLKFLGIGAAATAASTITACSPDKDNFAEIDKKELSFKEVDSGTKIPLIIGGVATEVMIAYVKDVDSLQIRQRGKGNVTKSFEGGAETVRKFGEITDANLYEIKGKSPNLGEEITVGVYPTTNGNKNNISGSREDLGDLKLYALKVIVNGGATENYEIDNPPLETNKNYHKNNSLSVPEFGQGLAVGHVVDGEINKVFYVEGYVCDARAVELQ